MSDADAGVVLDVQEGQQLQLSRYLKTPVTVASVDIRPGGPVLMVESSGGTVYRLRAIDDDDPRLLMEKRDGSDGWEAFIRLGAQIIDHKP
jgi:hypothetical protein